MLGLCRKGNASSKAIKCFVDYSSMTKGSPKAIWDIFISYSRRDQVFVHGLAKRLQASDRILWVDWNNIPLLSEWRQEIRQGILSAHNFLFILSPDSLDSVECAKELECAVANHKRLVPIVCRPITGCKVPQPLADINWIPFEHPDDKPEAFEQSFQDLLKALDTDLNDIKVHTRLLMRADEWESQQRDRSFLLRGRDLEAVETWLVQKSEQSPLLNQPHLDYVATSRLAETRRQKIILGSVISALALVMVLGLATEMRRRQAVTSEIAALNSASNASLALNNPFEALIQGLRANLRLRQASWIKGSLKTETLSALGQDVYWVQERNRLEEHSHHVYGVEFSPDGQLLASVSLDGTLKLWDLNGHLQNGHLQNSLNAPDGGKLINVRFSPDGQMLATCGENTPTQIWSRDGELLYSFNEPDDVYGIDFSPDGKTIATASLDGNTRLRRLDGPLTQTLPGSEEPMLSVSFNPVNSTLVAASQEGTLYLWQTDGTLLNTIDNGGRVYDVKFSPDGTAIATAGRAGVVLWRPDGSQIRKLEGSEGVLLSLDFSVDGQFIAAASTDRQIYIWRQDGTLVTTLSGHQAYIWRVSFSPDTTLLASASEDLSVRVWQWDNPWMEQLRIHTAAVNQVAFNPQTQQIVSGSRDGTLNLWTEQGQLVKTLQTAAAWINGVAVSPDGQWMAAAGTESESSETGVVQLWTAAGEDQGIIGRQGHWVSAVAFSADNQLLAAADDRGSIQIRDLSGTLQHTLELGSNALAVGFSPDGRMLAAGGEGAVKIWDLDTQALIHSYERPGSINSLSFSPDSQTLVFASSDRSVGFWPLTEDEPRLLPGHQGEVLAVQFSPDGRQFASAGRDNQIRLWSDQGTAIATIGSHAAGIRALQFGPDGSWLVSASEDKTLILWNIDILQQENLVRWGCDWVRDYLQTNPQVSAQDRTLCQGIKPWNPQ